MKRAFCYLLAFVILFSISPLAEFSRIEATGVANAWVLVEVADYENAERWAQADAHASYIVTHSYSRGIYSASNTYEGEDIYGTGLGGTLAVKAVFTGVPNIIYPDQPVSLNLSFIPTQDTVNKLSFTASASADFDQWDVGPGAVTRNSIPFVNGEKKSSFLIVGQNSVSYNETITASLGSGSEKQRIALRCIFSFGVPMGTNYIYEWKPVSEASDPIPTFTPTSIPVITKAPTRSPTPVPPKNQTYCILADLYGEVNVRPNDEDDDAYIFAEIGMYLYHNDRIRTLTRSGAIIGFSDLSSYVMKEDTIIVLDIAYEQESKIKFLAGKIWINLKSIIKDGSMEVEMSQAIAGARGTTFVCEEEDGISTLKVLEGLVEFTSKISGEAVVLSAGQMISADSSGLSAIASFNTEEETQAWDEYMHQMTAQPLNPNGSKTAVFLIIGFIVLVVCAGLVIAAVIVIVLIKRKH